MKKLTLEDGTELVSIKKFNNVKNNVHINLECNSGNLYVTDDIQEDDNWAEFAYLEIPKSILNSDNSLEIIRWAINVLMEYIPDEVDIVSTIDNRKLLRFWWD